MSAFWRRFLGGAIERKYEILEEIARGGMSVIHRARHRQMDIVVALKILLPQFTAKRRALEDLIKDKQIEGEVAALLDHPNIVRTYEYGRDGDRYYFAMEYIDGMDVRRMIDTGDETLTRLALKIMLDTTDALAYLHARKIIHRDICPGNIVVNSAGEPKLIDFGLAIFKSASVKRIGERAGTPSYMSPEQVRGMEVDERSDIYSWGMTMYKMATGRLPFQAEGSISSMSQHLNVDAPPPSDLAPTVTRKVEKVIMRAVERDPARRYQTMRELQAELKQVRRIWSE